MSVNLSCFQSISGLGLIVVVKRSTIVFELINNDDVNGYRVLSRT